MSRIANGIINAIFGASAGAGDAVDPTSIFSTGWPAAYEDPSSGLFPEREYFNFLLRALYSVGKDINTHGILEWSDAVDYTHPAVVLGSDNEIYKSLQNSGPSGAGAQDPTTATEYWGPLVNPRAVVLYQQYSSATTSVTHDLGWQPDLILTFGALRAGNPAVGEESSFGFGFANNPNTGTLGTKDGFYVNQATLIPASNSGYPLRLYCSTGTPRAVTFDVVWNSTGFTLGFADSVNADAIIFTYTFAFKSK